MKRIIVDKANRYDEPLCLMIFSVQGDAAIEYEHGRQALQQADFGIVPEVRLLVRWSDLIEGETVEDFIARAEAQDVKLILTQHVNRELENSNSPVSA
ncbi:MAG: hypothetical protein ABFR65_10765 [Pseudomonadota bacterium]